VNTSQLKLQPARRIRFSFRGSFRGRVRTKRPTLDSGALGKPLWLVKVALLVSRSGGPSVGPENRMCVLA
jgi:hypothetical protein